MLNPGLLLRLSIVFAVLILLQPFIYAELLETTVPITLAKRPVVKKIGDIAEISAISTNYTNLLPIEGAAIRFISDSDFKPVVQFKFFNTNLRWSEWLSAKVFDEPQSDRWIASINTDVAVNSVQFEIKIEVPANTTVQIIEQGIFPVDIKSSTTAIEQHQFTHSTDIPMPTIITRQEWGARQPTSNYEPTTQYTKLTVHHAAGWQATNLAQGKMAVKAIQDFHIDGRGWIDIAYHFLIDDDGNIYQGRPETVQGAHTYQNNTGNIGVCMLGCFDPPYEASSGTSCHQHITTKSRNALVHLFAWLITTYGYPNADLLKGHRDYYDYERTSCPGQNIHQLLPEIRAEINEFVKLGGPPFEYSVLENYPNPFFTKTNIVYELPVKSTVTLNIFNINGKKIKTLVDNVAQEKGTYTVVWNSIDSRNHLSPAGIYIYKLEAQQNVTLSVSKHYTKTGKMLFLK